MLMTINQVAQKLGVDYQTAVGLLAYLRLKNAVDVTLSPGEPGKRAFSLFLDCWEQGLLIRTTGDTVALSPPLIIERSHIDQMIDTLRKALVRAA